MVELDLYRMQAEIDAGRETLAANEYPGRVIIQGLSEDGKLGLQAYALTGRGEGSKRRIFIQEGDTIRTVAPGMTPEEMNAVPNAALIYYRAMESFRRVHVVSNGAQTEHLMTGILDGKTLEQSLRDAPTVTVDGPDGPEEIDLSKYEPDGPKDGPMNYTPRINAVMDLRRFNPAGFGLTIVRKNPDSMDPIYESYHAPGGQFPQGTGFGIQTYLGNGTPLPSYDKEPFVFPLGDSAKEVAQDLWDTLAADKRAAVVVKAIDLESWDVLPPVFIDNYENPRIAA